MSRFRAQSAQEEVKSAGIQTGKAASVEGCITSRTGLARLHRLWRLSLSLGFRTCTGGGQLLLIANALAGGCPRNETRSGVDDHRTGNELAGFRALVACIGAGQSCIY